MNNNLTKDFELKDTEVAIALDKDWSVNIYIPKLEESEYVPDYIVLLTKIAVLLRDEDFIQYVFNHEWPDGVDPSELSADE